MKRLCIVIPLCILLAALAGCGQAGSTTGRGESVSETEALTDIAGHPEALTDIAGHPKEAYILEGLRRGFYRIPPDGLYRPDDAATGAEFAAALWNLDRLSSDAEGTEGGGEETPPAKDSGEPTSAEDADTERVYAWMTEAGYASADTLPPDRAVTRLSAMELLFARSGGVSGVEAMFTGLYDDGFQDSGEIPPEGKAALYWGFYNVLIRETERYRISPADAVSRGDMAEILVRFMDSFMGGPPEQ